MTGIFYGSSMGNTEEAAKMIKEKLVQESMIINITEVKKESFDKFDTILLGSSTWGLGDLQDDWDEKLVVLKEADLSDKKIGFFGCGDQESYPDTFADALGTIYEAVKDSGAEFIGSWSIEGYTFSSSTAVCDGSFVGLVLDEDNQADKTEERVAVWAALI